MRLINRKIALILATVMLATSALTPVYAAVENVDQSAAQNAQDTEVTDGNNVLNQYSQEELAEQAKAAALALEKKVDDQSEDKHDASEDVIANASETYTSEDGSTSIRIEEGEDGTPNVFYDSDEELIIDENMPQTYGDYEYIGTSPLTGMSIYRTQMDATELENREEEYDAAYEKTMAEVEQVVNWFQQEPLNEDQIANALKSADTYAQLVKDTYFEKIASESQVTTATVDISDASPSIAIKASESQTGDKSATDVNSNGNAKSNIDVLNNGGVQNKSDSPSTSTPSAIKVQANTESIATPDKAYYDESNTKTGTGSQTGKVADEKDIPKDGDVINDGENSEENLGVTSADESDDGIRKVLPGTEYVQVREPSPRVADDIEFKTIDVTADESEIEKLCGDESGEPLLTAASSMHTAATDEHTMQTTEVCIVHSDSVYFQVNSLVDENTKVGVNGAAITISYKDDNGQVQTRSGVTADAGVGHAGYLSFKGMSGLHDCFVDVSLAGHAAQTYFMYELEGGHMYDFNLVPVKTGQIYLRAAAIDGVDIYRTGYTLNLKKKYATEYDVSYIVTVADKDDSGLLPDDVIMRAEPQRESGKEITAQNRDRKFIPDKNDITDAGVSEKDSASKMYKITAPWTQRSNLSNIPAECPAGGDDVKKVRFSEGNILYLDLPEGTSWAGTDSNSMRLQLNVQNTVAEKNDSSSDDDDDDDDGVAWWETINLNIFGSNGSSFGISGVDVPGLRNGKFNCDIFTFKVNGTITPGGKGVISYNPVGPLTELYNNLKAKEDLMFRPSFDFKSPGLMDTIKAKKDAYYREGQALRDFYKNSKSGSAKAVWNLKVEVVASLCGIFQYDRHTKDFSIDLSAGVTIVGKGEITGYFMIGPCPFYLGVEGTFSAGISGDVGIKFNVGNGVHKLRMTNASGVALNFMINVTAYVGIGLRKVIGFEGRGGGYFSLTLSMTKGNDPFIFSGGFNLGYKVYVLFCSWSADFYSDSTTFYPKDYDERKKALAAAGVVPIQPLKMQSVKRSPMEVSALIAEGRAESGEEHSDLDNYYPKTTLDPTKKYEYYTDESEVIETELIAQNTSVSTNFQYVSNKNNGTGMILRIANVETKCSDGKTRVIPRTIATIITPVGDGDAALATDYVINPTTGDPNDQNLDDEEKSTTYCYDYSFSGVASRRIGEKDRFTVAITSGPENQEELEIKAVRNALKTGADPQKALIDCRAKNQHLRVVEFNINGKGFRSNLVHKDEMTDVGGNKSHDYAFVGTPVVIGETSDISEAYENFHWWAVCPISTDLYSSGGKSDGYFIARHYKTTDSHLVADGKNRSNISLMYREDAQQRQISADDEVMVVSTITKDDIKNPEYGYASQSSTGGANQEFSAPRIIEKDIWVKLDKTDNVAGIYSKKSGHQEFNGNVVNLGLENQDPNADMYFTVGDDIYRVNYNTSFKKLTVTDEVGNPLTIPKGDDILNYYTYNLESGQKVLYILCAYNKLREFRATASGTPISLDSDMVIATYRLEEKAPGTDNYVCNGPIESLIPDKSIYQMDGTLWYGDPYSVEPTIKVYYLANVTSHEETTATLSQISKEFKSFSHMCNLYVWNWAADYGAKLTGLSAKNEVVQYDDGKFYVLATYKNVGPKPIDGVMIEYRTVDSKKKSDIKTIQFYGYMCPGETWTKEIEIPIEKDWDGWVKVEACITKVQHGSEWLDSNEAGFKPVWISSEKLAGKIDLIAKPDDSFDTDLSFVLDLKEFIADTRNLILKAYKQRAVVSAQGITFVWDETPYQVYKIENEAYGGHTEEYPYGHTRWNLKINTATISDWFSGLYTEGAAQQLTNRYQKLTDIDYTKFISGIKYELCGYGDDTWNVPYDTEIVYNPMYDQVCNIETRMDDPYAGYVEGVGYVKIDGSTPITVKAQVNDGYKITSWTVSDGVPYEVKADKKDECTFTPYKGARYLFLTAQTERDNDYFITRVPRFSDESGKLLDNMYAQIGNWDVPGTGGNGGSLQYAIKKIPSNDPLQLHIDYDYHTHKLVGWYSYKEKAQGGYATESEILATGSDLELSYTDYPSGMAIVRPVFAAQDNPIITFDPDGGSLLGVVDAATNDEGILPDHALQYAASKEGYEFIGWYTKDGRLVDSGTRFTENCTVYAHYKSLRLCKITVRSNHSEYGDIILQGTTDVHAELYVYDKDQVFLAANPNTEWGYEFDGWKVYEKENDGSYTDVTETRYPLAHPTEPGALQYYEFNMNDKDVIVVAQFKKTAGYAPNIYFASSYDERGYIIATCSASVSTGKGTTLDMLGNYAYRVNYEDAKSWAGILLDSEPLPDFLGDYYFDGFYRYSLNLDGSVKLGEKLPSNYLTDRIDADQFIYANWIIKKVQPLKFEKSELTIDSVTKGKINTLSGAVGEVTYSSSDTSVVSVNAQTGEILEPKQAGMVIITAKARAIDEYASTIAEYSLTITRAQQKLRFDNSKMTINLGDAEPARNILEGAKTTVRYESDNPDIATVSMYSGDLWPGILRGDTVITVTAEQTNKYQEATATYEVHVNGLPQNFAFDSSYVKKAYGDKKFTVGYSGNKGLVTFSSDRPNVATVNSKTGEVSVGLPGMALITANAQGTDQYEPGKATYTLEVQKATQSMAFESAEVSKRFSDGDFVNKLNGAQGNITYQTTDRTIALVDENGRVVIRDVGDTAIIAISSETDLYKEGIASFNLHIAKGQQTLTFDEANPTVEYGSIWYTNVLNGAKTPVTYSASDITGTLVAEVEPDTGHVLIRNAGKVTIRASASETTRYEGNKAEYTLTVTQRDLSAKGIKKTANRSRIVILDGTNILEEGKDYTVATQSEGSGTRFNVTGIGNYKGFASVYGDDEQEIFVIDSVGVELSESIPPQKYTTAIQMLSKSNVEGLDDTKVPSDKIIEAVTGTGANKIPAEYIAQATTIGVVFNVDIKLESIKEETSEYRYSLEPSAVVVAQDAYGGVLSATTSVDAGWFSPERTIAVTLGVADSGPAPNKVVHKGDDGKVICNYTSGTSTSGNKFVYDAQQKTVKLNVEHFSDIEISYEAPRPTPPGPSPKGGGSGGSGGGGGGAEFVGGGSSKMTYSKCWFRNAAGQWKVKDQAGNIICNAWLCDDGIPANGKNVWYLLNADGVMVSAGLVQDLTGNYYSLETNHNGYYGMLRYKDGYYNCNGTNVYLQFKQSHNGSFAAIKNPDGIAKLKEIYGVTHFNISNANIVQASNIIQ